MAKACEEPKHLTLEAPDKTGKVEIPVEWHSVSQIKKKEDIKDKLHWKDNAEQKEKEMMEMISELSWQCHWNVTILSSYTGCSEVLLVSLWCIRSTFSMITYSLWNRLSPS